MGIIIKVYGFLTLRTPAKTSSKPVASYCEVANTANISPDFTSKLNPDTSNVDLFSGDVISKLFTWKYCQQI